MSVSPTRSVSRSPRRSNPRGSPKRSPSPRRSPTPRKYELDDEWPVKKSEAPRRRGCAFIQSERGCRKGNACTFSHDPADVADPRWHKCAGAGCSNLCRGTFCPRCRNRLVQQQPPRRERQERSRSPRRPKPSDRARSRSRDRKRSRERDRSRDRPRSQTHAYCSQCGRRY
jgi:hypothetical protein